MMKWIFVLLLLVNVLFFAVMQWGKALTVDTNSSLMQAEVNPGKIKIVSMVAPALPVSAVAVSTVAVSAVSVASAVVIASSSPVAATVTPPAKLSCMEWGEFSGADLQRADKALAAMRLGGKVKQRIVEHTSGYWVYISPMKTHAQVKRMVDLLKRYDVEDYFVVQESGAWKNAISLGVFKTEESAQKYWAKLQGRGLKSAKMDERSSKLKFTVFMLNRLDSAAMSQVTALRKDFPDSEIKQVRCN